MRTSLSVGAMALAISFASGIVPAADQGACDRTCLKDLVDTYLAALVAHDPGRVPFAAHAKLVENVTPMKPGEGLWQAVTEAPDAFRIYVPDPVSQQVGFIGILKEGDKPLQLGLRLQLREGKVTEAEHLVARNLRENSLRNLDKPRPAFLTPVPPSERDSREALLKIAATYYDALVNGDGSATPFADDCVRRENGMQTTGNPPPETPGGMGTMGAMGCAEQLDTKVMSYIKRIDNRRVEIADPESGLVFGLSHFRHPMEEKFVKIEGVPGVEKVDLPFDPFDLPAAHIYKISGGQVHEIEAMGFRAPYNAKTGWE